MLQHRAPRSPRILKSSSNFQGILKPNSYLSAYQILKTFKFSTYWKWAFIGAGIVIGGGGGQRVGLLWAGPSLKSSGSLLASPATGSQVSRQSAHLEHPSLEQGFLPP